MNEPNIVKVFMARHGLDAKGVGQHINRSAQTIRKLANGTRPITEDVKRLLCHAEANIKALNAKARMKDMKYFKKCEAKLREIDKMKGYCPSVTMFGEIKCRWCGCILDEQNCRGATVGRYEPLPRTDNEIDRFTTIVDEKFLPNDDICDACRAKHKE